MNCRDFNDSLHEYLDQTLPADVQAAAREHLAQCDSCRRALAREEAVAKSVRHSLDLATAGLSLHPETRRNILKAAEPAPKRSWLPIWGRALSLWRVAGAALVIILSLVIFVVQPRWQLALEPHTSVNASYPDYVVDVPIYTQTRVFRVEGDTLVDSIAPSEPVGRAHFESSNPPSKTL